MLPPARLPFRHSLGRGVGPPTMSRHLGQSTSVVTVGAQRLARFPLVPLPVRQVSTSSRLGCEHPEGPEHPVRQPRPAADPGGTLFALLVHYFSTQIYSS